MEFTYFGGNCVLITTKTLKIIIDPAENTPKQKADVTLLSTASNGGFSRGDQFVIDSPGEYEIKTVSIHGIPAQLHIDQPKDPQKGIMYSVEYRGVRALITGNIAPSLKDKQVEDAGAVNVLVIPVGGHGLTLDANATSSIVGQFEPSFVIPVHYDDGKTKYVMPQDKVDVFLKEMGSEDTRPESKLKVTEKDLLEGTKVALLSRQG